MTSPSPQLFCQPDDTARDPATGITHWLATVVLLFVNDHAASHDGILAAVDRDVVHGEVQAGLALGVGLQIAKIARMPLFLIGKSVWVAFGVVVAPALVASGAVQSPNSWMWMACTLFGARPSTVAVRRTFPSLTDWKWMTPVV